MAEIRIIYQIENASFNETPLPETKRILHEIIASIENGSQGGLISDINGNSIGAWVIEGGEQRYKTCTICNIDLSEVETWRTLCDGCLEHSEGYTD